MSKRSESTAATRAKILAVAKKHFAIGYEATTIRDIARAAGLSTGAVFHSWPDKQSLWHEATGLPTPEEALAERAGLIAALEVARGALRNAEARLEPGAAIANVTRALVAVNAALPASERVAV